MAADGPRQRKAHKTPNDDGTSKRALGHLGAWQVGNYGPAVQILRSLIILSCFMCACICIFVTQVVGSPLYFVDRNYFNSYMAMTKRSFGIAITALTEWACPTPVRVSGDKSVQGQIGLLKDGRLDSGFPKRLVLIANHQVYTDWLYLWWVSYTNRLHGHIYIILKESLKYIPFLGQGMMFYGFIFMARKWLADKPRLQHRLQRLNAVVNEPSPNPPVYDPMWLLIFPEGTNLSPRTKKSSDAYAAKQGKTSFKNMLLPRSTGLFFCLQQLRGTVDWVYDCTIGYDGHPKDMFPEAYFTIRSTYLRKRPPKAVNLYWRRFAVSDIPLDDQAQFETWLYQRWAEKDRLLQQFIDTGRFPAFEYDDECNGVADVDGPNEGAFVRPAYIQSEMKLGHWMEAGKIFGVLFTLGVVTWWLLYPSHVPVQS